MDVTAQTELWQSVSRLRPEIRSHIRVNSQDFRGQRWYVLHDESAGRFLRVNAVSYELIGRFDGDLSLGEILEKINLARATDQRMTIAEVLEVMAQLHEFEALDGGLPVTTADVVRRFRQRERRQLEQRWSNPLSIRVPLIDPDRLLNSLWGVARFVFSPAGFWLWVLTILSALTVILLEFENLAVALGQTSFALLDVISLLLLYPVVKALHELGHGLAIKRWGGEVHEAGIFFLVFLPVPYVDGSACWGFRDKRKRALVSAAGILTELFLAATGILLWALTEPGLVNDIALKVAVLGGLSTLLYNGNPLLKFDGYYVVEDLLEVPNLASRSTQYYLFLIQRYLLRMSHTVSPASTTSERTIFLVYGLLSPAYRLLVLLGIAIFLTGKYLVVGVALACWAIFMQVIKPLFSGVQFLIYNPQLQSQRRRSVTLLIVPMVVVAALLISPFPLVTRTQGVVWIAENGQVTVPLDGSIAQVHVEQGQSVNEGDRLLTLKNSNLEAQVNILKAQALELQAVYRREKDKSRVRGVIAAEDLQALESELEKRKKQLASLEVLSPATGEVVFHSPRDPVGDFVRQGDTVAYVVQRGQPTIRAIVDQDDIGKLRSGVESIEVMLSDQPGVVYPASLVRQVPASSHALPSAALGTSGGGPIRIDESDSSGLTAQSEIFQFDIALAEHVQTSGLGGRALVRLDHGTERLWTQWSTALRQLFLTLLSR